MGRRNTASKSRGHHASGRKPRKALTRRASAANLQQQLDRRTRERDEALAREAATAEVLQVISSSTGELERVFEAILENATRICDAKFGVLHRYDGNLFRVAAVRNVPEALLEFYQRRGPFVPPSGTPLDRLWKTRGLVRTTDDSEAQVPSAPARLAAAKSHLAVPMLKDNELVGAFIIYRQEVRPFTDKQIELVQNFAAQAVIAIENTRLLNELRQRTDDLTESLEQQTATSKVLGVISSSAGELGPVFEVILENATRICEAKFGNLTLWEGDGFRAVAVHGEAAFAERRRQQPKIANHPGIPLTRLAATKSVVHIPDFRLERVYVERLHGPTVELVEIGGARTALAVPMLKDDDLVGAIILYRTEVRPFTNKQIELVSNFAAQAVIAIENARLLNELRQRTDDLTESLEQQTAMSQVLGVISSSPTDLHPVFQAIVESAARLCQAYDVVIWRPNGDQLHPIAHCGPIDVAPIPLSRGTPGGQSILDRKILHIPDLQAEFDKFPGAVNARTWGLRALLCVPLIREGIAIGMIALRRREAELFTDKQVELVTNFAAQAVIAIENTRLLNELRQRTDDLTESLEQQTATSEVLRVISSSPGELEPVFQSMLENAMRICEAERGGLFKYENGKFQPSALRGGTARLERFVKDRGAFEPSFVLGRLVATKSIIHIEDLAKEYPDHPSAKYGDLRTGVWVPMVKDTDLIGAFVLGRNVVRPFTEKQINLLQNFAAQAVIAIENMRLLNELRESLQQQTATADVLKVISRSTFDLQTVLTTLLQSAARLCAADRAALTRQIGESFQHVASYGFSAEYHQYMGQYTIPSGRGSVSGRALLERKIIHVTDVRADPEYAVDDRGFDVHTALGVPLLREGTPLGVIILQRTAVRPFTDKQIELVATFADQAAIAIENVRLFESVEARTRELAKSLEDLRTTQDRLVQTEKLASLGQLTAGIAHEIKNPLNFVNNFSAVSTELIDELQGALTDVSLNEKKHGEITELVDTLRGNLDKVVQHGKRADAIVKNMLLHSRQGSAEHRPVDINALVEESLNLAYHGARAEQQGFNITLEKSLDPSVGEADVFPQDVTRVLLNLISNGFYAATRRKAQADGGDYEPMLAASTKDLGDRVEIRIRDNGTGIPPEVKEQMFNPFFTTKPAGEGTGLGLSISHDIIVKQHGGSIEVDTTPGEFTEFRIVLPRQAGTLGEGEHRHEPVDTGGR
jgi:two-component system NtrC family sensor kinase